MSYSIFILPDCSPGSENNKENLNFDLPFEIEENISVSLLVPIFISLG